ncbi:hypothetical protein DVA67_026445 [Solirubrobacter sp. CPCC 204708]|uniref:DUF3108 domain-containing protein n=1 Tax=Solirubrobacter deserti TaxID=2282478 RepID=A0ABT4RF90_9ACTN|nr:hypothetical protein [Solirubrobacter deserti]MBE2319535.1 hypothetical protein [Solirubrobacter deserti]MDA0137178.1 hypothetical protein [Solirubrobacter deserti]
MNLDAYMDDFGRDLHRAAHTRRSRRRAARLLLPAVPAGAALAVAISALPSGGGGVDAIAAAREALAPDGEIVHMKIELRHGTRVVMPSEQWYAANPTRWRTRFEGGVIGRRSGGNRIETAFFKDRLRFYDAWTDTVTIWRDAKLPQAGASPSMFGGDPATDLRAELDKGDVRDDGVVSVDGRQVRRLVREDGQYGFKRRFVYHVDPKTFEPIGGHMSFRRRGGKFMRGPQFKVTLYERLPLNARNEQLLKFDKTLDTRYVWR